MRQITKEYDFSKCRSLMLKVHSIKEEDYNSLAMIRIPKKQLWLDHCSYQVLNKD